MSGRRIVGQHSRGWQVNTLGGKRTSVVADTQGVAIDRGRDILEGAGEGKLTIRGGDGRIRDSDAVPSATGPFSRLDKK